MQPNHQAKSNTGVVKRRFGEALRVCISLIFIFLSVYFLRDKWSESFLILKRLHWGTFALACTLFFVINCIAAYRLHTLLRIQGIAVRLRRVLYLNFIGLFFNLFLPSSVGGDVVKAYYLSKDVGVKIKTISTILVDRMLGLGAVILVALIALPFFTKLYNDSKLISAVLVMAAGFVLIAVFLFNKPLAKKLQFLFNWIPGSFGREKLAEFYHSISRHSEEGPKLFYAFLLSLAIQCLAISMGFIVAKSIGLEVSFLILMVILPVTAIISMLPSCGGLGVREASVIYFLKAYTSVAGATAFILAYDILIYGFGFFCGILYLFFGGRVKRKEIATHD